MTETPLDIWKRNQETINSKSLAQIVNWCDDGKLRDDSEACNQFRALMDKLPSDRLEYYIQDCIVNTFEGSGFALQDMVNEVGKRLGFQVNFGLYHGGANKIGHDGLWKSPNGEHDIVIEVKTSDVFGIDVHDLATYRRKLIERGTIKEESSSALLIVGREGTGGLEAQIRGSRHAWDIRLISVEALLKLLKLKENLLDNEMTFQHIVRVLKPLEFTRLDDLIDTLFITGQDSQPVEVPPTLENPPERAQSVEELDAQRPEPVSFHSACVAVLETHLGIPLKKQTKTLYDNKDQDVGITCAVSKEYNRGPYPNYWFAFHQYQQDSLSKYQTAYVCFGCGSNDKIFMFPFKQFEEYLGKMWYTIKDGRKYWHIIIRQQGERYFLTRGEKDHIDISDALLMQ